MTWASISLRKMELKNRINDLEAEDINISQQLQTLSKQSSRDQESTNLDTNYQKTLLSKEYQDAVKLVNDDKKADATKKQEALTKLQQQYTEKVSLFESQQQMISNSRRDVTDSQVKALEAQQQQVETQLKAANAEYQNLGEAMDQDIKDGAIKLV